MSWQSRIKNGVATGITLGVLYPVAYAWNMHFTGWSKRGIVGFALFGFILGVVSDNYINIVKSMFPDHSPEFYDAHHRQTEEEIEKLQESNKALSEINAWTERNHRRNVEMNTHNPTF